MGSRSLIKYVQNIFKICFSQRSHKTTSLSFTCSLQTLSAEYNQSGIQQQTGPGNRSGIVNIHQNMTGQFIFIRNMIRIVIATIKPYSPAGEICMPVTIVTANENRSRCQVTPHRELDLLGPIGLKIKR